MHLVLCVAFLYGFPHHVNISCSLFCRALKKCYTPKRFAVRPTRLHLAHKLVKVSYSLTCAKIDFCSTSAHFFEQTFSS